MRTLGGFLLEGIICCCCCCCCCCFDDSDLELFVVLLLEFFLKINKFLVIFQKSGFPEVGAFQTQSDLAVAIDLNERVRKSPSTTMAKLCFINLADMRSYSVLDIQLYPKLYYTKHHGILLMRDSKYTEKLV